MEEYRSPYRIINDGITYSISSMYKYEVTSALELKLPYASFHELFDHMSLNDISISLLNMTKVFIFEQIQYDEHFIVCKFRFFLRDDIIDALNQTNEFDSLVENLVGCLHELKVKHDLEDIA